MSDKSFQWINIHVKKIAAIVLAKSLRRTNNSAFDCFNNPRDVAVKSQVDATNTRVARIDPRGLGTRTTATQLLENNSIIKLEETQPKIVVIDLLPAGD